MLNASRANLNLLVVLHAVLAERSVTRAAQRLGVTQAAVSNALAQLRELLGDPLVVRSGRGVAPTPRALELAPRLAAAVAELDAILAGDGRFDPETAERRFAIELTDNQEIADLPRIVPIFARRLPRASLRVVTVERMIATDGLASGEVDAALAPAQLAGPGLHRALLYREGGVAVARRDHPAVGEALLPAQIAEIPWIDVHVHGEGGIGHRLAREAMGRAGALPRVALVVPHFLAAAAVAASTDYVAGLPRRFAEAACRMLPLRMVEAPFLAEGAFSIALFWHERTHADAGARCFREIVIEALRE